MHFLKMQNDMYIKFKKKKVRFVLKTHEIFLYKHFCLIKILENIFPQFNTLLRCTLNVCISPFLSNEMNHALVNLNYDILSHNY